MTVYCHQPCDSEPIEQAETVEVCARWRQRHVLAAAIIGSSMAFIDGTVVNVALPVLQAELDATVVGLQWIVESYALFLAALLLVGGLLGDRFGRRRMLAIGTGIFAIASLACGLAPDTTTLIAARAVQGIGAALLVPGSLALISANFGEAERGRAIGTWSGMTALAMALGPVGGGWLVDHVSWRWVFYINLPLAVLVLAILFRGVPESRDDDHDGRLDWPGAAIVTLGLGALVFGLIESGTHGIAAVHVGGSLAAGLVLLAAFLWLQARGTAPMMPLELFRSPAFSGANLITLLLYAALGGALFFLPFNLMQVQGYSATAAGAAFLPLIAIMFVLSRWAGGLVDRYGGRPPLIVGPLIAGVGFALFAIPSVGGSYWTTFFPAVTVLGLGMAISVPPLTTVVLGAVEQRRAGIASGINNAVARVAGLLAIAVMGVILLAAFNARFDAQLAAIDLPAAARAALDADRFRLAGIAIPDGLSVDVRIAVRGAIDEAFVVGFRMVMLVSAGLAVLGAVGAAVMLHPAQASPGT